MARFLVLFLESDLTIWVYYGFRAVWPSATRYGNRRTTSQPAHKAAYFSAANGPPPTN